MNPSDSNNPCPQHCAKGILLSKYVLSEYSSYPISQSMSTNAWCIFLKESNVRVVNVVNVVHNCTNRTILRLSFDLNLLFFFLIIIMFLLLFVRIVWFPLFDHQTLQPLICALPRLRSLAPHFFFFSQERKKEKMLGLVRQLASPSPTRDS